MFVRLVIILITAGSLVHGAAAQQNQTKQLLVKNDSGETVMIITADADGGIVSIHNAAGNTVALLGASEEGRGLIILNDTRADERRAIIESDEDGGLIRLHRDGGTGELRLSPSTGVILFGRNGEIASALSVDERDTGFLSLVGEDQGIMVAAGTGEGGGGFLGLGAPGGSDNYVDLRVDEGEGQIRITNRSNAAEMNLSATNGLYLSGGNGAVVSTLSVDDSDTGFLALSNANQNIVVASGTDEGGAGFLSIGAPGRVERMVDLRVDADGGLIIARNNSGSNAVLIAADSRGQGLVEISGSRAHDLAEPFELASRDAVIPGTVMAISHTGSGLVLSDSAYDPRVVGVVSGAGDLQPGMLLGSRTDGSRDLPIALSGQVNVRVSLEAGPIAPGDLLVASSTPGVAMRAHDRVAAIGAIVGKALGPVDAASPNGEAMVRMLVMAR